MNLETISSTLIQMLIAFEAAMRRLNPLILSEIREGLLVRLGPLTAAREFLLADAPNAIDESVQSGLLRACDLMLNAVRNFGKGGELQEAFISALRAARKHCRAQEVLYPLCGIFPEVNRYFLEPGGPAVLWPAEKTHHADTGIFHVGADQNPHARGGYSLYIPETYTPEQSWPLVVALHGGYSHGKDFIWTWLREARSRGFILFAPTSQAMTWSIANVEVDEQPLRSHLEQVCSRVNIDRSRILLTGMSDGGTFALAMGMSGNSTYQVIAPVSCVLPPVDLRCAKGKRILWVHGAQDWIFPVSWTVQACKDLLQAGADIKLKVVQDLSHTYPREENDTILKWFEMGRIR
jgi:phospholipase/carboxylesterase